VDAFWRAKAGREKGDGAGEDREFSGDQYFAASFSGHHSDW